MSVCAYLIYLEIKIINYQALQYINIDLFENYYKSVTPNNRMRYLHKTII